MIELYEYAEQFLELGVTTKDGHTRREHMIAAGYSEDELINTEFPPIFYDLWHHFLRLHYTRGSNGFSVMPISYTEMSNYFDLMCEKIEPWEMFVIKRLDSIALQKFSEKK